LTVSIIIAEASLELVPNELQNHPSVRHEALRRNKSVSKILLDRSLHHSAMLRLENSEKRGRPDLVHMTLLQITCAPIFLNGKINAYVHTVNNEVMELENAVRIPKSYFRFQGLMEKLLAGGRSITEGKNLISLSKMTLPRLVQSIGARKVIGFSRLGQKKPLELIAEENIGAENVALVVGGFAKGTFSNETSSVLDCKYSISNYSLDSHVVCARVLYEFEKKILR
jgi:rRNA small subunit pseudouridine methyltransferase Nep1